SPPGAAPGYHVRERAEATMSGEVALQVITELELVVDSASLDRALAAVARSEAAGLFDLAWMDGCPLLTPLRALAAWAPLRDAVAARATRIRAAKEDGAAGAA